MSHDWARLALAAANYGVAVLNLLAASESYEARDWLAFVAWMGSGTFWLWQALA